MNERRMLPSDFAQVQVLPHALHCGPVCTEHRRKMLLEEEARFLKDEIYGRSSEQPAGEGVPPD